MPHQDIRLDIVLSDWGQDCVDLSPIENYNFGLGPNFTESPSSLLQMFYDLQRKIACCSAGTLAADASPEHYARYSSFWLTSTLCRFESHQKLQFWMGPKICPVPKASNSLATGPIEFFDPRSNQKHFWIGPQLFPIPMFLASHVIGMQTENYTSSLKPSWILPYGSLSSALPWMFPSSTHLVPHSYDF